MELDCKTACEENRGYSTAQHSGKLRAPLNGIHPCRNVTTRQLVSAVYTVRQFLANARLQSGVEDSVYTYACIITRTQIGVFA
jgi:hypothetical protein